MTLIAYLSSDLIKRWTILLTHKNKKDETIWKRNN